jgi:uncharacterized cupin superfamily protein
VFRAVKETSMGSGEGVYVSSVSATDWADDPDVPGTEMHELIHEDGVWVGMTRITSVSGPLVWTPEHRETVHVLEGSVRIESAGRPPLELAAGDIASFPAGTAMTWHVTTPFKELWFFAE